MSLACLVSGFVGLVEGLLEICCMLNNVFLKYNHMYIIFVLLLVNSLSEQTARILAVPAKTMTF